MLDRPKRLNGTSQYAIYFGDLAGNTYALNAESGQLHQNFFSPSGYPFGFCGGAKLEVSQSPQKLQLVGVIGSRMIPKHDFNRLKGQAILFFGEEPFRKLETPAIVVFFIALRKGPAGIQFEFQGDIESAIFGGNA